MTKEIPLTKDKVALVDDEDYEELSKYKWYYTVSGYAARDGRNTGRTEGSVIYMHKYLIPSDDQVDHINRNKLDNRKRNLRPATNAENGRNRGAQSNNRSGYRGVSWSKVAGKWSAELWMEGTKYYLGLYDDIEEAARMYNFWANDIHGEFACLNEIEGTKYTVVCSG